MWGRFGKDDVSTFQEKEKIRFLSGLTIDAKGFACYPLVLARLRVFSCIVESKFVKNYLHYSV